MKIKRQEFLFFVLLLPSIIYQLPTPSAAWAKKPEVKKSTSVAAAEIEVALSTSSILAKIKAYDEKIERIAFKFTEEFFLVPTGEKEKLTGRVYFDRKNFRVRADYSGRVKYKLWIEKDEVYLFDESLRQVVIRKWEDFGNLHMQAFMDLPVFFDMGKFEDRYLFSVAKASPSAAGLVYLRADPKKSSSQAYHLLFGIDRTSGRPGSLKLIFDNYEASLTITDTRANAKFSDKIFDRQFPKDTSIIDMRKRDGQFQGE